MGKMTRALIRYNHTPDIYDRPLYSRMSPQEDDVEDDSQESPLNMLSAIIVVLVVSVLSMLSLNTIFFIHKGQKENARLAQSFLAQKKQMDQLTHILGNRQQSVVLVENMKRTQSAMAERDAEWQEFAKNQYSSEIAMDRLQEDQNVMLEKMIQMNTALKDLEDTLKIKEGK